MEFWVNFRPMESDFCLETKQGSDSHLMKSPKSEAGIHLGHPEREGGDPPLSVRLDLTDLR